MKHLLCGEPIKGQGGVALLLLRLAAGAAFIIHGWPKFQHAFSWMQDPHVPGFLQALAAFSEFVGGMALVAGALTRLAALGIWFTMSYALFFFHLRHGDPFVSNYGRPSYELALLYWVIMTVLVMRGGGAYSLDGIFHNKKK